MWCAWSTGWPASNFYASRASPAPCERRKMWENWTCPHCSALTSPLLSYPPSRCISPSWITVQEQFKMTFYLLLTTKEKHWQWHVFTWVLSYPFLSFFQPPIPDPNNIRDFVSYPTAGNERLHCTMKRAEDSPEAGGPCYTLYLEYLGGLVPILKGRRISKLRPEFVIMDPKTDSKAGEV